MAVKNKWAYGLIFLLSCFLAFVACSAHAAEKAPPVPLPVDQAFKLSSRGIVNHAIQLHWEIAPGYHLYRDRFHFLVANTQNAEIGQVILPPGISKSDAILGKYQIYQHSVDIQIPLTKADQKAVILLVSYQGCSEADFCYPPITKRIKIDADSAVFSIAHAQPAEAQLPMTMQDKVTQMLQEKNYFWICLAFIGFGLLLAFTPCVLPMIPILSGIIVGQDRKSLTTRRAFFLSLSYVLGMAFAYAIAGVLVALAGSHLAQALQAPWVIILFSILFVLLALSLFDVYELRLPHFIQHPVLHLSNRQRSGSYWGALIMGALSVLIVSPCVTAPLVGVLTFIAQTGDIFLGSTALFSLGLGMGIPLLIIGTTEGKFMPKSGAWMHTVKSAFGVLLIGIAIYLLQRVIPAPAALMLWSALLIILAVYLGLGAPLRGVSSGFRKFGRGLGLLSFCYGVILLIGAAMGHTDPLRPLQSCGYFMSGGNNTATGADNAPKMMISNNALNFQRIRGVAELQTALSQARRAGRPVMLDFYANWCVSCHEMARTTFADANVQNALKNMVLLQADITANDATDRALQDKFNVIAPPTILFFDKNGNELLRFRIVGAMSPRDFLQHIDMMTNQVTSLN